jgi:hypothetical protein
MDERVVTTCEGLIRTCYNSPYFFNCIVAGDEPWVVQYHPETKGQGMERRTISSQRPKNFALKIKDKNYIHQSF